MSFDPRKTFALIAAAGLALAVGLGGAAQSQAPVSPDARKVLNLLDQIEREPASPAQPLRRRAVVSETELNAYIAYRIAAEKENVLRELQFKLFPEHLVEGRALIDLSGRKIPAGIRPRMTLLFAGKLRTMNGKVRLELDSFYLEEQKIQPAFLDFIISVVSRLEGSEPWKLDDWQDLPYGIREMWTEKEGLCVEY